MPSLSSHSGPRGSFKNEDFQAVPEVTERLVGRSVRLDYRPLHADMVTGEVDFMKPKPRID